MKKIIILAIAAIAATIALCSFAAAEENIPSSGTVTLESVSVPALNFSMPASRAVQILALMPDSIVDACRQEYRAVRTKCNTSSRFTHEGVQVRVTGRNGSTVSIEFSVPGYKVSANDVSWTELDAFFAESAQTSK